MVAEMRRETAVVGLLYEPDQPEPWERAQHGWVRSREIRNRISVEVLIRDHFDDAFGAMVQHAIVRQVRDGALLGELTRILGRRDRQTKALLAGHAWAPYGRPVLRALARLGISPGRGQRSDAGRRYQEIIAAQRSVMARALVAMQQPTGADEREQLLADLRLLTLAVDDKP